MSPLAAKILIVGVPLLISLAWFLFWVLRLTRAARNLRDSGAGPNAKPEA
jgi:ABC-type uncharacterized transport system permease subunit